MSMCVHVCVFVCMCTHTCFTTKLAGFVFNNLSLCDLLSIHVYAVFLLLPNKFPLRYIEIVSKGINVRHTSALMFKDLTDNAPCSFYVIDFVHLRRERV